MTQREGARTGNQYLLLEHRNRFIRETSFGQSLVDYLVQNEIEMTKFESTDVYLEWLIYLRLPQHARDMFELHNELLLVYTEFESVEPRLLERARKVIDSRSDRLEPGIAVIFSRDPSANLLSRRQKLLTGVHLNTSTIGQGSDQFRQVLARDLTVVDNYDQTNPIQMAGQFFGRHEDIDSIDHSLNQGQSVGIFGLRKTGKTSLLLRLKDLRLERKALVQFIDLSAVSNATNLRHRLLQAAARALHGSQPDLARKLRFACVEGFEDDGEPILTFDEARLASFWLEDFLGIIGRLHRRLELFIDEVDQATPDSRSKFGPDANEVYQTMVQLRGPAQAGRHLALAVAGVDPVLFESPLVGRQDNLLYKLVRLHWLGPLEKDEMKSLVRDVGRTMGVRVESGEGGVRALELLYAAYGGHALLTRKACSKAVSDRSPDEIPFVLTPERVAAAIEGRGVGSPRTQAHGVRDSFKEWFPDEAALLEFLTGEDPEERKYARESLDTDPDLLQHAVAYGLLFPDYAVRIREAFTR
ncbi:hypothetical protein ACVWW9_000903 [Agrococcus sp. UYP33]